MGASAIRTTVSLGHFGKIFDCEWLRKSRGVDGHRSGGIGGGIGFFEKAETPGSSQFPDVVR